jgi:predicted PurR-regulated permease PerM
MQKPKEASGIDQFIKALAPSLDRLGLPSTKREIVDQYIAPHKKDIAGYVEGFFRGAFNLVPAFGMLVLFLIITPLLVVYMLVDMDRLKRRSATWIPPSIRAETLEVLRDIGQVFESYLRGVTTAILMYMAMASAILWIVGAPYSVLLGMLFGALYLIPYIGPALSWTILFLFTGLSGKTAVFGLAMASPWSAAILVTVIFFAADRSFDLFVYPRIVGRAVGLNPIVSFFVVFSGGALFGIAGMLLAFPLAGAVKVVLDRLIRVTSYASDSIHLPAVPLRHRATS